MDSCTLYHLRNQLQRRSVTKKVKSDPTCCEEFFLLVTTAHVLYACGISSLEDIPSDICFSNFSTKSEQEIFEKKIREVIDKHINFKIIKLPSGSQGSVKAASVNIVMILTHGL